MSDITAAGEKFLYEEVKHPSGRARREDEESSKAQWREQQQRTEMKKDEPTTTLEDILQR
eukprot:669120-Hanusia_phi.AAC.1